MADQTTRERASRRAVPKSAERSGPRTKKGEQTRAQLVTAAKTVFERDGFLGARIVDIAETARVATGSFYHYFDSKEQIFRQVAQLQEQRLTAPEEEEATTSRGAGPSARERIRRANRRYLERYRREAALMGVIEQVSRFDTEVNEARMATMKHFVERAARSIRQLQAEGLADPRLNASLAADALGAMVARFAEHWLVQGYRSYDVRRCGRTAHPALGQCARPGPRSARRARRSACMTSPESVPLESVPLESVPPQSARRDDDAALFVRDGEHLVPTAFSVGPWRPDALHGSAVAALFGALLDEDGVTVARVTMDLLGAVRVRPLRVTITDGGGGRRVRRRTATLHDGERDVAQATALYVATASIELPESARVERPPAPPASLSLLPESRTGWPGFENRSMEVFTSRERRDAMYGWFRLVVPAIAGGSLSGLQSTLAAADYTSGGTVLVLSMKRWAFMSTDLTVHLVRPLVGDWVGLTAGPSTVAETAVGVASSVLHDEAGVLGRCAQTQFLQALPSS